MQCKINHGDLKREFYPILNMFWLLLNADYDFEEVLKFSFLSQVILKFSTLLSLFIYIGYSMHCLSLNIQ